MLLCLVLALAYLMFGVAITMIVARYIAPSLGITICGDEDYMECGDYGMFLFACTILWPMALVGMITVGGSICIGMIARATARRRHD